MSERVKLLVIASGGYGKLEHVYEVFKKTKTTAALAASIFHYNVFSISEVKKYLAKKGIAVRL